MENKGLLEYEATGKITSAFLTDFSCLCLKIYSRWKLNLSIDDFTSCCKEKLLLRIGDFDPSRSNIGNYVFNLILNEARRIHSLDVHLVEDDATDFLLYKPSPDNALIKDLWSFAILAYKQGIYIDQDQVLADYQRGIDKPCVKVFSWMRSTGRFSSGTE